MKAPEAQSRHWCEALYETCCSEIVLYGRALGLSHSEAEDVLQDTFLAVLRGGTQPSEPRHYLLRAFRNRALNFRRGLWRRAWRELESARWFEKPENRCSAEEDAMRLLPSLPSEQREVIVLKIWHEMTYDEIGALLEVSPNTVAGRYRYGMEKLRAALKGNAYEQLDRNGEPASWLAASPTVSQDSPHS